MNQEVANSTDRERLSCVGLPHESDEAIGDRLDRPSAPAVGKLPNCVEAGSKFPINGNGKPARHVADKAEWATCVFERNVLEPAFSEAVSIQPDPAVSERLANVIHSNVLCGLDATSPESSQESNQ